MVILYISSNVAIDTSAHIILITNKIKQNKYFLNKHLLKCAKRFLKKNLTYLSFITRYYVICHVIPHYYLILHCITFYNAVSRVTACCYVYVITLYFVLLRV